MNALVFADNVRSYIADPDGLTFHGDTLGVNVNLTLVAPIISGVMLLLCVLLWRQSVVQGPQRAYSLEPRNLKRLGLLAVLLPIRFALLRFGTPHGLTDQIGVVLTILQWLRWDGHLQCL